MNVEYTKISQFTSCGKRTPDRERKDCKTICTIFISVFSHKYLSAKWRNLLEPASERKGFCPLPFLLISFGWYLELKRNVFSALFLCAVAFSRQRAWQGAQCLMVSLRGKRFCKNATQKLGREQKNRQSTSDSVLVLLSPQLIISNLWQQIYKYANERRCPLCCKPTHYHSCKSLRREVINQITLM